MTRLLTVSACAGVLALAFVHHSPAVKAIAPPAAAKRPLAIEDYYKVKSVGGVQISPNGQFVIFTTTTRVEETNGSRSEAWVVPADASSKARKIEHEGKDVTGAGWTPENLLRYTANNQ